MVKFLKTLFWILATFIATASMDYRIYQKRLKVDQRMACEWGIVYTCAARGCTVPLARELFKWCRGQQPDIEKIKRESK